MTILGLDIGGANLKAADESGKTLSRPFAIWKYPERLKAEVTSILGEFPQWNRIVLTMTAELADCFTTKREGVRAIVDAVDAAARESVSGQRVTDDSSGLVRVWSTDGRFVDARQACDEFRKVAAANWHAMATWCAQHVPHGSGLLIDVGTTTTDIIPIVDTRPTPVGLTDLGRLQSGELSYSGVWRTPLCAVAHSVPFRDSYCSVAAELFATTLDIHLLLDRIPEQPDNRETADGKPATKVGAHDRIAHMLCCDREEMLFEEAVQIARFLADVQRQRLAGALERVVQRLPSECKTAIITGSGNFLARQLVAENRRTNSCSIISIAEQYSPGIADATCAYALTQLANRS